MKVNKIVGDKYKVVSIISNNESGIVGECINKKLNNLWIVKFIPKKYIERSNEIENMLKINSCSIPKIIDCFIEDEGNYYIMDYIKGRTIDEYFFVYKYDINKIIKLMNDTCEALKDIHRFNIIHGDIKGENIMVDDRLSVFIIDFGSSFIDFDSNSFSKDFVAPERLLDHTKADLLSDLYSFGVVFNNILKDYKSHGSFKNKKIKKLEKIIKKCMEIDPKNRFEGSVELSEAIKLCL